MSFGRVLTFADPSLFQADHVSINRNGEEIISLSGAKSQSFFAIALAVSAMLLCWKADAVAKPYKQVVRSASPDIMTQIAITDPGTVTCRAYNKSDEDVCVVYDVYPIWYFSQPERGTVSHLIPGKTGRDIAWTFPSQQASMKCKLVSARYTPRYGLCQ